MNCPNCGNEIKEGSKFCSKCGADLSAVRTDAVEEICASSNENSVEPSQQEEILTQSPAEMSQKANRRWKIILVIVICAAAVAVCFFVWRGVRERQFQDHMEIGQRYMADERYEEAVAEFRDAIQINPKVVEPYIYLAEAYESMDDFTNAEATYDEARTMITETYDRRGELPQDSDTLYLNAVLEAIENDDMDRAEEIRDEYINMVGEEEAQALIDEMDAAVAEKEAEEEAAQKAAEEAAAKEAAEKEAAEQAAAEAEAQAAAEAEAQAAAEAEAQAQAEEEAQAEAEAAEQAAAEAESSTGFSFADIGGQDFGYSSGVGAWGTAINVTSDGTFTGGFHNWDGVGGVTQDGVEYYGTYYVSDFSGTFSAPTKVNDYTWSTRVGSISYSQPVGTEEVIDGNLYHYEESVGIREGDEFLIYLPSAPMTEIPTIVTNFSGSLFEGKSTADRYILYNETEQAGFL